MKRKSSTESTTAVAGCRDGGNGAADCAKAGASASALRATEGRPEAKETLVEDLGHLPVGARGRIAQRRARGLLMREWVYDLHVNQGLPLVQVGCLLGLSPRALQLHWERLQTRMVAEAPRSPKDFVVLRERIGAMLWRTVQFTCPRSELMPMLMPIPGQVPAQAQAPSPEQMPTPVLVPGAAEGAVDEKAAAPVPVKASAPAPKSGRAAAAASAAVPASASASASAPAAARASAAAASPPAPLLSIRLKALDQLARLYDLVLDAEAESATAAAAKPYATPEEIAAAVRERLLALQLHSADPAARLVPPAPAGQRDRPTRS